MDCAVTTPVACQAFYCIILQSAIYCRQSRFTNEYTMKPYDYDLHYAEQARTLIESDIRYHYTIQKLAARLGIGEKRLKIAFKQHFGKGIFEYLRDKRIKTAKDLLQIGATSQEIAHQLGYKNAGSFSRAFKKVAGQTPQAWANTIV